MIQADGPLMGPTHDPWPDPFVGSSAHEYAHMLKRHPNVALVPKEQLIGAAHRVMKRYH